MELVTEDENRKIFREDGKFYTMINMGSYVGHQRREWWETPQDAWFLMMYDIVVNDKKAVRMDALVDSLGTYSRIGVEQNGERQYIFLRNGNVLETLNIKAPDSEKIPGYPYKSNEEMLQEFLQKNQELQELIKAKKSAK